MKTVISLFIFLSLCSCFCRNTNLEDVAEMVESKGKGVRIDIEPGYKGWSKEPQEKK